MSVSDEELEAVVALDATKRYAYFVKRVVDRQAAFGLWQGGWALAGTDDAREVFPLWPAPEFALACASGSWSSYRPEEIALDRLLQELMPSLRSKDVGLAVFPTPSDLGVARTLEALEADLAREFERY